jgi:MOSC domain-containing protein YiiM
MARIAAVCLSAVRGTVKEPVPAAELRADHGLVGDAHAGPGHRQVSLLAAESIERVRAVLPDLSHGAFGENLVTAGLELGRVRVGDRLRLEPSAELEVTQIGKECHTACAIGVATGDCIMPREGIFCRVVSGGPVAPGTAVQLVPAAAEANP